MVLVILAVLAAIMVPTLTGWIDKAKEKQLVVTGRTVMLAGQSAASEAYGESRAVTTPDVEKFLAGDVPKGSWSIKLNTYKVQKVEYTDGTDLITYDSSTNKWTLTKNTAAVTAIADPATKGNETLVGPSAP